MGEPRAVIFDLDGVLVDSEQWWDQIRRQVVADNGGTWTDEATTAMLGMSTPEWAGYLVEALGVELSAEQVATAVIGRMADRYADGPPLLADAVAVVGDAARRAPVAIATSSPPTLIAAFLDGTGLRDTVRAAVSSEEVAAGKPDPAVYLAAADRLGVPPEACVAVEDSTNGLRSALAAGMTVVAVPNPHFPPDESVVDRAAYRIDTLSQLPSVLDRITASWPSAGS
ncbi:MAG: HAD family phosphatase [Actinocatenispora sp.]